MGTEARRSSITSQKAMDDQMPSQGSEAAPTTTAEVQSADSHSDFPRHISGSVSRRNGELARNLSTRSDGSCKASRDVSLEPPVTKATLSELDVNKIIHNPKLRHDINFDPELHFRPNLDGEKGKRKQDKANQFWAVLNEQLTEFITDPMGFQTRYAEEEWCLPLLLRSVKEIIQTLVPARDRMYLDEGLNVDLIMQQFNKGIADMEKLASWLSGVLKSHCAPMRDEWVDEMYNQLTSGNRTNNVDHLVQGMRSLLSVLEAMKLDVANHQIRCLRPILIEDTVHFEKRFFWRKMQTGKMDTHLAELWYAESKERLENGDGVSQASKAAFGEMAVFFEAVAQLVLPSRITKPLPPTFLFDDERMLKLRSDMLDAINLEICMRLFEKWDQKSKNTSSGLHQFSDIAGLSSLCKDDDSAECNFNCSSSSRPASGVFSSAGSASSSPRSSMVFSSHPTSSPADAMMKTRNLYSSLVALLQSSPSGLRPAERWSTTKPSIGLQIFRFTDLPTEHLAGFEEDLDQHLDNIHDDLFREVERQFHEHLLKDLQRRVKEFKVLNGVGLFTVATGARVQTPNRAWDGSRDVAADGELTPGQARDEAGIEDMATRLAHLGLLHWRVWSQLAYQGEFDSDMAMDTRPDLN
jgi:hypothetical protein